MRRAGKQFSVTSGTIFANRKLPIRDYLVAIAIFVNAVKGILDLQLGRDLDVQYKTAFVMAHDKIREAIGADRNQIILSGTVEIDGAYFGGKTKEKNVKAERVDRRLPEQQTGKRQVVVAGAAALWPDVYHRISERIGRASRHPRSRDPRRRSPCRQSRRLGSPTCPLRDAPDQPFRGL